MLLGEKEKQNKHAYFKKYICCWCQTWADENPVNRPRVEIVFVEVICSCMQSVAANPCTIEFKFAIVVSGMFAMLLL